ncbi:hypothetical protein PV08_06304 [Exophiala spinifera]|uniref:Uncharacterized protein n=1 Tax=Exophiala spinifera TaxID=91928 RepID=A0A0D2BB62_9EURO|nr:uncharacterized protein PV08_06304 [Exophiala spinifera]KIW16253.1 hypothetical protein PV08_06304 [Exophiala spinifera]
MCFDHPVIYICRHCEGRIRGGGYVRVLCPDGEDTQRECQFPELGAEELREASDLCSRCLRSLNHGRSHTRYQEPIPEEYEGQYPPPPYRQQRQHATGPRSPSRERARPRQQLNNSNNGHGNGGGHPLQGFDNLSLSDDLSLPPDGPMPARDRDDYPRRDHRARDDREQVHTTLRGGGGEPNTSRSGRRHWDDADTNSIHSASDYDRGGGRGRGRKQSPGRDHTRVDSRRRHGGRNDNIGRRRGGDDRLQSIWDRDDGYSDSLRPSSRSGYSGSTGWSRQSHGPFGITRTTDEYGVPEVTVPVLPGTKVKKEGKQLVQVRRKKGGQSLFDHLTVM